MAATGERMNGAARATAEKMLEMFGGETLTLVLRAEQPEGDAAEMGYATHLPVTIDLPNVLAHVLYGMKWELLIGAAAVEDAMQRVAATDAAQLFEQCVQMRIGERVLTLDRAAAIPVGGAAYLYRVFAKESE